MHQTISKVAIVTGASRGIGAAIAQRLAHDGYAVVINYASRADDAEALVMQLQAGGHDAIAIQADVSRADDVRRLFHKTEAQWDRVDVLINNAGVLYTAPLADTTDAMFERTMAINVQGTFNTLREAAARLQQGGRIVNLSSTTLALNLPGYALYNASKAAVEGLTRVFAKELRGRNITVNAVAPGPVATELFMEGKTAAQIEHFATAPPLERLGQPEDIARAVSFLVGPDGDWVNGQVLRANGGLA